MRFEPTFQNHDGRERVDRAAMLANDAGAGQTSTSLEAAEALVEKIDRELEMCGEPLAEPPYPSRRGTLGAVHIQRQSDHQASDFASFDLLGDPEQVQPERSPFDGR